MHTRTTSELTSVATEMLRNDHPRVTVVIPCLNEAENIEECVRLAFEALQTGGLSGEVVVVDNGSEDASAEIAEAAGARVIPEPRRGYGNAYLTGFENARGDYLVMIDADLTYDFAEIPRFIQELDDGAELVMGNRMEGVQEGAMSLLSRLGNPLLSGFLNLVYRTKVTDAHCGMRALRRDVLPRLRLRSTGMEFASEMVIRASRIGLRIHELPIELRRRGGESKLHPFRDGWRHLRLMLVHSPNVLFIFPGLVMAFLGAVAMGLVFGNVTVLGRHFFIHTLIAGSMLAIIGCQVVALGLCGRAYGVLHLGDPDPRFERAAERLRLEHGLLLGAAVTFSGLALAAWIVITWIDRGFGTLSEERLALLAATLLIIGIQIFFTSFLISIIAMRDRR